MIGNVNQKGPKNNRPWARTINPYATRHKKIANDVCSALFLKRLKLFKGGKMVKYNIWWKVCSS